MKPFQLAVCAGVALALSSTALQAAAPAHARRAAPAERARDVDPEAVQALQRMSAYLGALTEFQIKATTGIELVMDDGQKVELDAVTTYKVHRPDGFLIETSSDQRVRQFYYNGKQFTVVAPELGYYATVAAPPTIRQTLDLAADKYHIALPLEDLFRWSDPHNGRPTDLISGFKVGPATLDGVETDQYAFREGDVDWQIWIARGDQPEPLKVVIIDRLDPAHPYYVARLNWNTAPSLAADTFTYTPAADAKAIRIAATGK